MRLSLRRLELDLVADLGDLLRVHRTEIIAPACTHIGRDSRDLLVVERVCERRHDAAADENLPDHVIAHPEEPVLAKTRADTAEAVFAVASETARLHEHLLAGLGRLVLCDC